MQVNYYANSVYSVYRQNTAAVHQQVQQIAAGKKVNTAADNPAYLVMIQGMLAQEKGYSQAYENTQSSSSLLNTAEGVMGDSSSVLQDMRELSVQAANGTLTDEDRSMIQQQMSQLASQVTTNARNTQFNTINTNDGSLTNFVTQIGANSGQSVSFSISDLSAAGLGLSSDVTSQNAAQSTLASVDNALSQLSSTRTAVGAMTNRLEYTGEGMQETVANLQSSQARMGDTDIAAAMMGLNAAKIQQYATIYAMKQNIGLQQSSISLFA